MNLTLLVAGLALVALPGWTAPLGRRLAPRDWALLSAASLRTGLTAVRLGLVVTALPAVMGAVGGPGLAAACHQLLGPVAPGGLVTAGVSLTALVVIQARIVRARRRCRRVASRMRVEPWLGRHHDRDDHELVVVPTASSLAYAVEGSPPQIVVSDGLTQALTPGEMGAVIHHELCHLEHAHQRGVELARVTEVALAPLPAAGRSAAALRLAIERWADESAAARTDRAALRRALEKVVATMLDAVPAFSTAETLAARLDALQAAPRPAPVHCRLATAAPAVLLTGVVDLALVTGTGPLHHGAFILLSACPL